MNWKDEEIDKLFQDNNGSGSFEYKEAYWKEMEAMLPKKGGGDVLWMLTAILFIGWLGITAFVSRIDKEATLMAELNNHVIENNSLASNGEGTLKTNKSAESSNEINTTKEEINSTILGDIHENKNESEQVKGASDSRENKADNSNPNVKIVNKKLTIETDISSSLSDGLAIITEKESVPNPEEIDVKIGQLLLLNLVTVYPKNDSEIESYTRNLQMPIRSQLYVSAIGGLSQSMITPSDQISYSFGIGVGAKSNKGKFTFITGINWMWSYHNDLLLTREAKEYGFGSQLIRYELRYDEIISIEGDFSVGYQFGNNTINIGLRPSYILGTKINVREDDIYGASTVETHYGFTEGLNRFGLKPMLGYTYQFRHGLSLGMNIGVQVQPLVYEKFINGENNTLPVDVQIFLRKTLKSN